MSVFCNWFVLVNLVECVLDILKHLVSPRDLLFSAPVIQLVHIVDAVLFWLGNLLGQLFDFLTLIISHIFGLFGLILLLFELELLLFFN